MRARLHEGPALAREPFVLPPFREV